MDEDMGKASFISTVPKSKEEHKEFENLNNNFSKRLDKIEKTTDKSNEKEKEIMDKDKFNGNKKRVATTQGRRDDSDDE
ncbi:hypothetical protein C1646_765361 [Rhizophagus diaphanus]|nr:hypothetical protein C1646_765361 [Rhizophagus diaphanus] [Rhizophagus sp. MUCL 43196]